MTMMLPYQAATTYIYRQNKLLSFFSHMVLFVCFMSFTGHFNPVTGALPGFAALLWSSSYTSLITTIDILEEEEIHTFDGGIFLL